MGCDHGRQSVPDHFYSFNSRTHMGCDFYAVERLFCHWRFQFTHPYGVRPQRVSASGLKIEFQFTHPYGVRLIMSCRRGVRKRCFNSRTHMGCDFCTTAVGCSADQFQFTHPYGVRLLLYRRLLYIYLSAVFCEVIQLIGIMQSKTRLEIVIGCKSVGAKAA